MRVIRPSKRLLGVIVIGVSLAGAVRATHAAEASLPASDQLNPVRADLQRLVDQASREGLPGELLVGKVREGLAKGVAPPLILSAVQRLTRDLGEASHFLHAQPGKPAASATLIRALVEAHQAGMTWEGAAPLVQAHVDETRLARAIDVLGELVLRGYPDRAAGALVRDVVERDPGSVGHLVAGVEAIRRAQTVSRADALSTLGQSLVVSGNSLDEAITRSVEGKEHGASASNGKNGQGSDHAAAAATKKGLGKGMK
jgi:hypothetical protein